jgi:hypothetical protein
MPVLFQFTNLCAGISAGLDNALSCSFVFEVLAVELVVPLRRLTASQADCSSTCVQPGCLLSGLSISGLCLGLMLDRDIFSDDRITVGRYQSDTASF